LLRVRLHWSPQPTGNKPSRVLLRLYWCNFDLAAHFPANRKRPRSIPDDDDPIYSREVFLCARKPGAVCEPENVSVSSAPVRDGPHIGSSVRHSFLKDTLRAATRLDRMFDP